MARWCVWKREAQWVTRPTLLRSPIALMISRRAAGESSYDLDSKEMICKLQSACERMQDR